MSAGSEPRLLVRHTRERRILIGDDDSSGMIFFPSLMRYMSEGEQEIFHSLGHPVWEQIDEGFAAPVRAVSADYVGPMHVGDLLRHEMQMYAGRRSSVRTEHVFLDDRAEVVARGEIVKVWVNLATREPSALPDWLTSLSV